MRQEGSRTDREGGRTDRREGGQTGREGGQTRREGGQRGGQEGRENRQEGRTDRKGGRTDRKGGRREKMGGGGGREMKRTKYLLLIVVAWQKFCTNPRANSLFGITPQFSVNNFGDQARTSTRNIFSGEEARDPRALEIVVPAFFC